LVLATQSFLTFSSDPSPASTHTPSLHDALPICTCLSRRIFKGSISRSHTEYGGACGGCQASKAHREFFVPTRPQCQRFGFFGFNACSASGVGHYRFSQKTAC